MGTKMRKYSLYPAPKLDTVKQLLGYASDKYGDAVAYRSQDDMSVEKTVSFREFADGVLALGTYLFSLGAGNSKIALLGENSYELILAFFACVSGGAAIVLDRSLSREALEDTVEFSDSEYLICTEKYRAIGEALYESCGLKKMICLCELDGLLEKGRRLIQGGNVDYIGHEPQRDSLALIAFTSGTTGSSKGVMLTHGNLMSDALASCNNVLASGRTVLALPLNHTFGLVVNIIVPMLYGMSVYICSSVRYLQRDIRSTGATAAVFVPMMAETVHKQILLAAKKKGEEEKLQRAMRLSALLLKLGIDVRRRLFREIFEQFGGNLGLVICGGAALRSQIASDLHSMGIELLNGYGITECAPVVSVNRNRANKIGSVGLALSCNEVRISGEGEIQVRGSNVMQGYYKNPQATREAFTPDGWFKTGDIGYIDGDGFIFITGRIKNLIILSNGENLSPEKLEEQVLGIPLVKEVVVFAREDEITAEIYPDMAVNNSQEEISRGINELNRRNPAYMRIVNVEFRDRPFSKTTSMKIKRDYSSV